MFGGEGLGEYIPMAALRSTIPKESERELVLAAEQQQLEEEEVREGKEETGRRCLFGPTAAAARAVVGGGVVAVARSSFLLLPRLMRAARVLSFGPSLYYVVPVCTEREVHVLIVIILFCLFRPLHCSFFLYVSQSPSLPSSLPSPPPPLPPLGTP